MISNKWKFRLFRGVFLVGGGLTSCMIYADIHWLKEIRFDALYFFQLSLEIIFFISIGILVAMLFEQNT
ncbi:hypothetical protein [Flectobacillus major]|jgi:uncharacterized membrane protein (UPF0182 family)|uniref:hypothetical protein n=1 Tax=Flectobacillus major TaxID=103 RepID=UPI00041519C7|nr:hypothetical protein [Flectobacillus major]